MMADHENKTVATHLTIVTQASGNALWLQDRFG
jgi:hypothetical protein